MYSQAFTTQFSTMAKKGQVLLKPPENGGDAVYTPCFFFWLHAVFKTFNVKKYVIRGRHFLQYLDLIVTVTPCLLQKKPVKAITRKRNSYHSKFCYFEKNYALLSFAEISTSLLRFSEHFTGIIFYSRLLFHSKLITQLFLYLRGIVHRILVIIHLLSTLYTIWPTYFNKFSLHFPLANYN